MSRSERREVGVIVERRIVGVQALVEADPQNSAELLALETEISQDPAFRALARRLPTLHLTGPVTMQRSTAIHGPLHVPVAA